MKSWLKHLKLALPGPCLRAASGEGYPNFDCATATCVQDARLALIQQRRDESLFRLLHGESDYRIGSSNARSVAMKTAFPNKCSFAVDTTIAPHAQSVLAFRLRNSQDFECGLVIRLTRGFGTCRAWLHNVGGSRTDDSTICGRGDALLLNLFTGDVKFSGALPCCFRPPDD